MASTRDVRQGLRVPEVTAPHGREGPCAFALTYGKYRLTTFRMPVLARCCGQPLPEVWR
jgi:hypothetical protein